MGLGGWRVGGGITRIAVVLAVGSALVACRGTPQSAGVVRPAQYSPNWGQFFVESDRNPRQVSFLRLGAGAVRPAEYWVFEWIDGGQRLRALHRAVLRNELVPTSWRGVADGRFLVTFDDRFEPSGTGPNTIVLYDFVRNVTVAKRAQEFLPQEWLAGGVAREHDWADGPAWIDPLCHLLYPTGPDVCRRVGTPFLIVDLPNLSVSARAEVPASLPACVYAETRDGHAWEWTWSMGTAPEPDWGQPFALPTLLKGTLVRDIQQEAPYGAVGSETHFRYDQPTCQYVRCAAGEWRDPPRMWAPAQLPQAQSK